MSGVYELLTKGTVTSSHSDHPATRRCTTDVLDFTLHGLVFESSYSLAGGRYNLILTHSSCFQPPIYPQHPHISVFQHVMRCSTCLES